MELTGRRVSVVGLGKSNVALVHYLARKGAVITARDQKTAAELGAVCDHLSALGVEFQLGPGYLQGLDSSEVVFLTPGMRKDFPEIVRAREKGVVISTEADLFMHLCRAPIVGITGSSGKTTTTTLTGAILEAAGFKTYVGGNIGRPLIDIVDTIPERAVVVLELSSFQLELVTRSPRIAVITNISPNHLDLHASMAAYVGAKSRIYAYQSENDALVLNADDAYAPAMAKEADGRVLWFSRRREVASGAHVHEGRIVLSKESATGRSAIDICSVSEIRLLGEHNLENVLAACVVGHLMGATPGTMRDVVTSFTGVAHRLELVREHKGVQYYNDSIATTPARAIAGIRSFDRPVLLIAGGYDKNLPFDEFAKEVAERAKAVFLIGQASEKIARAIAAHAGSGAPPVVFCESLEDAVYKAKTESRPGDVVLLSPACASYDMFPNFEARGERFRKVVHELTEGDAAEAEQVLFEG